MAKFLIEAQYSSTGLEGLVADGAANRQQAVKAAFKSLGGKIEAFYFAFGNNDVVGIVDLPNAASAAAASILIGSTGLVKIKTTALLTVQEAEEGIEKAKGARYRPPGAA